MRFRGPAALCAAVVFACAAVALAQFDADRVIPNGGMHVAGWTGKIDAASVRQGRMLNDARLDQEGDKLHITTGPATTFWNPANTASGDYVVKASFLEPRFMELNSHPHSYGIFIGGNAMGTDNMSLVYCVTYGDGTGLVRGFAPAVFTLFNAKNPAVNKAAAVGQPVTNEIEWRVKGGRAECSVNGKLLAGYDKAQLVTSGRLTSTDGVFGIRFSHNVEAIITGFSMTKG